MQRLRGSFWGDRLVRLVGDLLLAGGTLYLAFLVRFEIVLPFTRDLLPEDRLALLTGQLGWVLLAQVASLYFFGFYDRPQPRPRLEIARGLLLALGLQGLALAGLWYLTDSRFPRSVLLLYLAFDYFALLAWRWLLDRLHAPRSRRVAIVGSGSQARELAEAIDTHHWHGLEVVGYVPAPGEDATGDPPPAVLGPCLGTFDDLPDRLADGFIDDLVLAPSTDAWQTRLLDSVGARRPTVLLLPGPYESLIGRMRYRWVRDLPLVEVVAEGERRIHPVKRALDLVAASLLLLASLPVLAVCAVLVRATSPGPVLYRQQRVGRGQRPFTLWKIRTMRVDAEDEPGEAGERLASPNDPRLTPVGATLRRYRLDEIPQLVNVLNGSMSLVGPRPERPGFVRRYLDEVPGYGERFTVQPGLTGLAQINGEYHSSAQNKLRYDLAYIANRGLFLDLSILFRTIKIVLTSRGT